MKKALITSAYLGIAVWFFILLFFAMVGLTTEIIELAAKWEVFS